MNRQERRKKIKSTPSYKRGLTKEDKIKKFYKNGITNDDLKEEFRKGYEAGFSAASQPIIRTCYAAICLALNELYGFGQKRCENVLNLVDEKIEESLLSEEAINEVWEKIGLAIDFDSLYNRIDEI